MINVELKKICLAARAGRDALEALPEQYHCKEVSLAVCYAAAKIGLNPCLCQGTFKDPSNIEREHFWVRLEGIIYDATADQFDEGIGDIHIISECDDKRYREQSFVIFNATVIKILTSMKQVA